MSDRLQELLRQRAAIQAHLAWLDREIVQARPTDATPATSQPPSLADLPAAETALPVTAMPGSDLHTPNADTILESFRQDSQNMRADVRKGCLLYFFGAFLVLGLGIALFYLVNRLIHEHSEPAPQEQHSTQTLER